MIQYYWKIIELGKRLVSGQELIFTLQNKEHPLEWVQVKVANVTIIQYAYTMWH